MAEKKSVAPQIKNIAKNLPKSFKARGSPTAAFRDEYRRLYAYPRGGIFPVNIQLLLGLGDFEFPTEDASLDSLEESFYLRLVFTCK